MKKIYIADSNSELIYDVSSDNAEISAAASRAIQANFDKAAIEIGKLIRRRVQAKKQKRTSII